MRISDVALNIPLAIAANLAFVLSVSHPPNGPPISPLRPHADTNAPAAAALPNVDVANIGILAILAAKPKVAPH